ncbi:MAG: hypothetical protein ACJAXQ_000031 [Parvibaculaceae bacterium]|jgi:hypothetical protein|tara:strand:- start:881 stop:2161 length:1281 start_codon:yes stop_codon:yes gene_type:complete
MELQEEYSEINAVYHKNLSAWPEFGVYDKHVDGLVPAAQLEDWEQFHDLVKTYRFRHREAEYVFRGQHRFDWPLQPSLDRLSSGAIKAEIAKKQLHNFRLSVRGRVPDSAFHNVDGDDIWAMGQHHGLATPLLDWTSAPYVELFFAFLNEDPSTWVDKDGEPENQSRVIYVLNKSFIEDLVKDPEDDPLARNYPKIVEPSKDDHGRLVNQAGLFTMAPYRETIESSLLKALTDSGVDIDDPNELSKYLCKIHIPNSPEDRRTCLQHLRKMNIHYGSLFPDVIGASGYCNELISEAIENRNKPKPAPTENQVMMAAPATVNDFVIAETDAVKRELILALIVDDSVKNKTSEATMKGIVTTVLDFIRNKAGVDWYVRDSQLSRLKNIVRRQLKQAQFPDDFVSIAAESISQKAAEMSKEKERTNGAPA